MIRVITKLPNSEQSYKGKVKTHNYINRQNQSTTGKLWKRNDPDLVQAFLKKWWVESDFKAPNLPLSLRFDMTLQNVSSWKCWNKMKNKKIPHVGTVQKVNRKIVERDKIDTPNTQIHDRSFFWLGTGTSIKKSGRVKLMLWSQT